MTDWLSKLEQLDIPDGAIAGLSNADKPIIEGKLLQLSAGDRPLFFRGQEIDVLKRLRTLLPDTPAGAAVVGMEELQTLAAFAKDQMKKSKSVRLSAVGASEWGHIQKNTGLSLKPYLKELGSLELQPVSSFEWSTEAEPTQASKYLPYISSLVKDVVDDQQYCMYDARRYTKLLTVTGMQAELGFTIRGTTDAALVLQHSIQAELPANGLRWLWELKRHLDGPVAGVLEIDAEKVSSSSSSEHGQGNERSLHSDAACQAMAALLLANIHAPDMKPAVTLTDLRERHTIFWLDGLNIMYYAAPNAAIAWALTKALLIRDVDGHSTNPTIGSLPESLKPLAKRQKFDARGMHSGGGELAQLAALSDSINSHEYKLSTTACMLKQLFDLPAFCTQPRSTGSIPTGMYT
ncbi:TPA: hypothetical protein ACH3X2_000877 [Trebouxia sp. C0005]